MADEGDMSDFRRPTQDVGSRPSDHDVQQCDVLTRAEMRLLTAKAWIRARYLRGSFLSPSLFQEPVWDLLLDLYVARCEMRSVRVKSATIVMNVPATTAGRWLDRLCAEGWILRQKEEIGKRMLVSLPDHIFERMGKLLDAAVASDRKIGLARMEQIDSGRLPNFGTVSMSTGPAAAVKTSMSMAMPGFKPAAAPANENERQRAVDRLWPRASKQREALQHIVENAARIFKMPMAAISILDRNTQRLAARIGLDADETKRDLAFCAHSILSPSDTLVVEDATRDHRFNRHPLVTGDPHIRFYAGKPILSPDGFPLGSLCVVDIQPHGTPPNIDELSRLAREVEQVIAG